MRRHRAIIALVVLIALAGAAAYVAWAAMAASKLGAGWAGLDSAWPYLLAGVLTVAVVIAGFLRLASFSDRKGYDDGADTRPRRGP